MRAELGFEPELTTEETFADFATGVGNLESAVERMVGGLASSLPDAEVSRG
jgi:hypothetical protein